MRYTAVVRLRKGKILVHQEANTFSHRGAAEKWAKSREVALEDPSALVRAQHGEKSLSQLIRWYIDEFGTVSKWQRTKQAQLEFLEKHPIGKSNALALSSAALIDHVRSRRAAGAGPATVGNDLTWIGVVLRAAKSLGEAPVDPEIIEEARTACRELRLLAKSKRRDASAIAIAIEGVEIERATGAAIQMSDTPENPTSSTTVLVSLFQSNVSRPDGSRCVHRSDRSPTVSRHS